MKIIRNSIRGSLAACVLTLFACQKPPAATADDAGKEFSCITGELIAGDRDPVKIKAKCKTATDALIADVIASLDLYRVKMAAPGCPDPAK